jgi:glycosyltransferase involved in cell wall biosynthesis
LAPVLAEFPEVNLEIFGSGGYASVRDLRAALAPFAASAFLGPCSRIRRRSIAQLDYVLSGLPEREALGLNLIEAQAAGTPVIAVAAPPFLETVLHGSSGFLYTAIRARTAAPAFANLSARSAAGARPDPRLAVEHLARFSQAGFRGPCGAGHGAH